MAKVKAQPGDAEKGPAPASKPSLRHAWPLPALVASVALLGGGLATVWLTRPKIEPEKPLEEATALYKEGKFSDAMEHLDERMWPLVDAGLAQPEEVRQYHLMRANAAFLAQAEKGVHGDDLERNCRQIIKNYETAEKSGARLDGAEVSRLADCLLQVGRIDETVQRAKTLLPAEVDRWRTLVRGVVEHNLKGADIRYEQTLSLLADLGAEVGATESDRLWVLRHRAQLLMAAGHDDDAVSLLLREMQRFESVSETGRHDLGGLRLLLGQAYWRLGQTGNAERQGLEAEVLLGEGDPDQAEVGLLLGRAALASGRLDEARERFAGVLAANGDSPAALGAMLGEAEAAADSGEDEAAVEGYAAVIDRLKTTGPSADVSAGAVHDSLMVRHGQRIDAGGKTLTALRLVEMAGSLYADEQTPADVLIGMATTQRLAAQEILNAGGDGEMVDTGDSVALAVAMQRLDDVANEELRRHFLSAGASFKRHALLVSVTDNQAYFESLWNAADSFDLGGDAAEAISSFDTYGQGAPSDDPRRPEARFRLAQLHQSRGEFAIAAAVYESLVHGNDDDGAASGIWADRATVPLAQCVLLDDDAGNDDTAERLLKGVTDGGGAAPEAREYREAVIELGRLYHAKQRFPEAIERLTEALERYPGDPRIESIRYRLGDANRQAAAAIDESLRSAMPQGARDELAALRAQRLTDASSAFKAVMEALDARQAPLNSLEAVERRNSRLYLADCMFDMGEFERAIEQYDVAREEYSDDPASLVAMVQIVNSYVEMGDWNRARTAQERARQQFERLAGVLPEDAWTSGGLPMEKKHWERWLSSKTELEQRASAGN